MKTFEDDPNFNPGQVHESSGGLHISRPYDPERDGHMQHTNTRADYPAAYMAAQQTLEMLQEIAFLRRRVWELEKVEEKYHSLLGMA